MEQAPLYAEVARGPENGQAWWLWAADGLRLRIGVWNNGTPKGTVLLLPGRTEYVEKYGDAARAFEQRGYATLAVDWRGQGLADRMVSERLAGHVNSFDDYLLDLDAVLAAAKTLDLPKPWHVLGHSMGGGIGLYALMKGLEVQTVSFTGPMWGIRMRPILRPVAWTLSTFAPMVGLGHWLTPSTKLPNYVLNTPFQGNALTRDQDMFDMLIAQLTAHPDLGIGGPTLTWLREALRATREMDRLPSPDIPCLCIVGAAEQIVDLSHVHRRMDKWPGAELIVVPDAEHEIMMEVPAVRTKMFDKLADFYGKNS